MNIQFHKPYMTFLQASEVINNYNIPELEQYLKTEQLPEDMGPVFKFIDKLVESDTKNKSLKLLINHLLQIYFNQYHKN